MNVTREEHLAWCKERALLYVDIGDLDQAFASMTSDLDKHPETAGHSGSQIGVMMFLGGLLSTREKMREFIEGFR